MLALALRQAYRKGATVAVIDPRPVSLPFPFIHLPVAVGEINLFLSLLVKRSMDRSGIENLGAAVLQFYDSIPEKSDLDPRLEDRLSSVILKLRGCRNPVLVCGTDIVRETTPSLAADHALLLQTAKGQAGLFYLMPGANAFGAALLSSGKNSFVETVEGIEKGSVRALLLLESDPFWSFPDEERLKRAIDKVDFLLVLDYLPSRVTQEATIFLPTRALFETDSSFINQEGRVQRAFFIHHGGIPVEQLTGGNHPLRSFRSDIPGGEPEAAWEILSKLAAALSKNGDGISGNGLRDWLMQEHSSLANILSGDDLLKGVRIHSDRWNEPPFSLEGFIGQEEKRDPKDRLELMIVDRTFGTEELSSYSKYSGQAEDEPSLLIQAEEAVRLNLGADDRIILALDGGSLEVKVHPVENMARGVMVLPRHRQLSWQKLKTLPATISPDQISPSPQPSPVKGEGK
jgi:NADH-quinone oxidoreductase subunit G